MTVSYTESSHGMQIYLQYFLSRHVEYPNLGLNAQQPVQHSLPIPQRTPLGEHLGGRVVGVTVVRVVEVTTVVVGCRLVDETFVVVGRRLVLVVLLTVVVVA